LSASSSSAARRSSSSFGSMLDLQSERLETRWRLSQLRQEDSGHLDPTPTGALLLPLLESAAAASNANRRVGARHAAASAGGCRTRPRGDSTLRGAALCDLRQRRRRQPGCPSSSRTADRRHHRSRWSISMNSERKRGPRWESGNHGTVARPRSSGGRPARRSLRPAQGSDHRPRLLAPATLLTRPRCKVLLCASK
jgi:hypothetical protein